MSVVRPDFWDYVPCRRKRIPNPWLKSLSKAQHCLLQGKKKKILENVFLKPWTYLQVCLSLFWVGEIKTAPLCSLLLPCKICWGVLQSVHIILFSFFLFYFSFPAEELLSSRLCFLIFFWKSAFCKSTSPFAGGKAGVYWALQLPWHSFACVWMFVFSKPFW